MSVHLRKGWEWLDSRPRGQKVVFALGAAAILLLATAAQVHDAGMNTRLKTENPNVRVIDLGFKAVGDGTGPVAFVAFGPLGQTDLGAKADSRIISYRYADRFVEVTPSGVGYPPLPWYEGGVGASAPTVDGVRATYSHVFPSTDVEIVSGINGAELVLLMRQPLFVGPGNIEYSFWLDPSPGLIAYPPSGPLVPAEPGPTTFSGGFPIVDARGARAFNVTPAIAVLEYRATPADAVARAPYMVSYEAAFPARAEGEREVVPLDYRVELVGNRLKLAVLMPATLLIHPGLKWPVRIDPGITNPISDSQYFADETIEMESDLVITATGSAHFSNCEIIMTGDPAYDVEVEQGGRMTLIDSHVHSENPAIPYDFTVDGTLVTQGSTIEDTVDGVQVAGGELVLTDTEFHNSDGDGIAITDSTAQMSGVTIDTAAGVGLRASASQVEIVGLDVTGAGGDGLWLSAVGGNITASAVSQAGANGIRIDEHSMVNVTESVVTDSGENGILVVAATPTWESLDVFLNDWSGIVFLDDHFAYVANSHIYDNVVDGVWVGLASEATIYHNVIEGNGGYGIYASEANPNVEWNTITDNEVGVWLEDAHKAQTVTWEDLTGGEGTRSGEPIEVMHNGPETLDGSPGENVPFPLTVKNNEGVPHTATLTLQSDENSWSSVAPTPIALDPYAQSPATLTVSLPGWASICAAYDVQVWADGGPPPASSVTAYVNIKGSTTLTVTDAEGTENEEMSLEARLMYGATPIEGETVSFKVDGQPVDSDTTDSDGWASVLYTPAYPPAEQEIEATFTGSSCYRPATDTGTLDVEPDSTVYTTLTIGSITAGYGDLVTLAAELTDSSTSDPLGGKKVHFVVNGVYRAGAYTDYLGFARVQLSNLLAPASYGWNVSFDGLGNFQASSDSASFTSAKETTELIASDLSITVGSEATYEAWLLDDEGLPVGGATISLLRGGTPLTDQTTGSDGKVTFQDTGAASLTVGSSPYTLAFSFAGTSNYESDSAQKSLYVVEIGTSLVLPAHASPYGDDTLIGARLLDDEGEPIEGEDLLFVVDGDPVGTAETGSDGWAYRPWTAMLDVSTYSLTVSYGGTDAYGTSSAESTLSVVQEATTLVGPTDWSATVGEDLQMSITLNEDDGPVLEDRSITVYRDGSLFVTGETDANGVFGFAFDTRGQLSDRYVFDVTFGGDATHAGSTTQMRVVVSWNSDLHANQITANRVGLVAIRSGTIIDGDTIAASDDGYDVEVEDGSLTLYNSTVGGGYLGDYRIGEDGTIVSANTSFGRDRVSFASTEGMLRVLWFISAVVRDAATLDPIAFEQPLQMDAAYGSPVSLETREDGVITPRAIEEYEATSTTKVLYTPHTLLFMASTEFPNPGQGVRIVMDASKNVSLFLGLDMDGDGIADALETAEDAFFLEAEGHVIDGSQVVGDPDASLGYAAARRSAQDASITDAGSFYELSTGWWRVLLRASAAGPDGSTMTVSVEDSQETTLTQETIEVSEGYFWYYTTRFELTQAGALGILVSEGASSAESLRLDRIAIVRELDEQDLWLRWPGHATDPVAADTDGDRALDGFELREHSYWYEAEWAAADPDDPVVVDRLGASNGRTLVRGESDAVILTLTEEDVGGYGEYELVLRAYFDHEIVESEPVPVTLGIEYTCEGGGGDLDDEATRIAMDAFASAVFRFNYRTECTSGFTVVLEDLSDTSGGLSPPVELDKVGLIRLAETVADLDANSFQGTAPAPVDGFTPAVGLRGQGTTGYLYYASSSGHIHKVSLQEVQAGLPPQSLASASVGTVTTDILYVEMNESAYVIVGADSSGAGVLYLLDPQDLSILDSRSFGGVSVNPIAYYDHAVFFTTRDGKVHMYDITRSSEFSQRQTYEQPLNLGDSYGGTTVRNTKAFYPFEQGIAVFSADRRDAGDAALWTKSAFEHPLAAGSCPPDIQQQCTLQQGTTIGGAIRGTPTVDMGWVYFVLQAALPPGPSDTFVLYAYDENGGFHWARNLGWANTNSVRFHPHPLTTDELVIAGGTSLDALDKLTGSREWVHDFGGSIATQDTRWAPAILEDHLFYPYDGDLFAFVPSGLAADEPDWGDYDSSDGVPAQGAPLGQDYRWDVALGTTAAGQPLVGDFDNDGYIEALVASSAGADLAKSGRVHYRNFVPWSQYGVDETRRGETAFITAYYASDPYDPDFDRDGSSDAMEIVRFAGYDIVEAEDAREWHAWNGGSVGQERNFNFFQQFGVTLTSGRTLTSSNPDESWIRLQFDADKTGTYRFSMGQGGGAGKGAASTVDLAFGEAPSLTAPPSDEEDGPKPDSEGYGAGAGSPTISQRLTPESRRDVAAATAETDPVRYIFENATWIAAGYLTAGGFVTSPVPVNISIQLESSKEDAHWGGKLWLVATVSFEFSLDMAGGNTYVIDLGLDITRVPAELLQDDEFDMDIGFVRIEDIDRLRVDRRGMDPRDADTDGDRLPDGEEIEMGWFPLSADPDEDGLDDFQEMRETFTDPGDRDTDHDGIRDRVEMGWSDEEHLSAATPWDDTPSWGSHMETIAQKFMGDPFYEPALGNCASVDDEVDRCVPNWDRDTQNAPTSPNNPDTDGDGLPDGWVDGWIYDPSGRFDSPRTYERSVTYHSSVAPIRYDVANWGQSHIYDNFPQIYEGEDLDLDGVRDTEGAWSFWTTKGGANGDASSNTFPDFARKGQKETDPAEEDTDGDDIPEGYEVWYATRAPFITLPNGDMHPNPTEDDADVDVEGFEAPSSWLLSGSGWEVDLTPSVRVAIPAAESSFDPFGPLSIRSVRLDLVTDIPDARVRVELWIDEADACGASDGPQTRLPGDGWAAVDPTGAPTEVTFSTPVEVDLGSDDPAVSSCLYAVVQTFDSGVTIHTPLARAFYGDLTGLSDWSAFSSLDPADGTLDLLGDTPSCSVLEPPEQCPGDGLALWEEYLVGTNPKVGDTDGSTAGRFADQTDGLEDGEEAQDHVIWRTDAELGALSTAGYVSGTVIYYDTDPASQPQGNTDWMYFVYWETVTDPAAPYEGDPDSTVELFRFEQGGSARLNLDTDPPSLYIYRPGMNFDAKLYRGTGADLEEYHPGTLVVYLEATGGDVDWMTNELVRVDAEGVRDDRFRVLYATSPFDWDSDDDSIGDGREQNPWADSEPGGGTALDTLNNARDPDADNDGLTDGQELLAACPTWNAIYRYSDSAEPEECDGEQEAPEEDPEGHGPVDPDGDGLFVMLDGDSDADGIPDGSEVLWSEDTDGKGWINLVDADSDGDLLCDGWCATNPTAHQPVVPDLGEDADEDELNEQEETSPVKPDTDGDLLWDGPDVASELATGELLVDPDDGTPVTRQLVASGCGSGGADPCNQAASTMQTDPDTDDDGVPDGLEVFGYTVWYRDASGVAVEVVTATDPTVADTDGDGISDGIEFLWTNGWDADTDGDGLTDDEENENLDGFRDVTETDPLRVDTDSDGLTDCQELRDTESAACAQAAAWATPSDPLDPDTDDDGVWDGAEVVGRDRPFNSDYDEDDVWDVLDADADDDGLLDGKEDLDRDGVWDTGELSPLCEDSEGWNGAQETCTIANGDGLLDGAEPFPYATYAFDLNSNDDGYDDLEQTTVVFRTNAAGGDYAGAWIAVDVTAPNLDDDDPSDQSYPVTNAWFGPGQVPSPLGFSGDPVVHFFGVDPATSQDADPNELRTPEGFAVFYDASSDEVYVIQDEDHIWIFARGTGDPPGGFDGSPKPVRIHLVAHQEVYDWRDALNMDADHDGLPDAVETAAGTDENDADSDEDGIVDGAEPAWDEDTDEDNLINALDPDSDDDGVWDGVEIGLTRGSIDTDGFVGDADAATVTDMLNPDTDGDGISDGDEDSGSGTQANDHNGKTEAGETKPLDIDTDDDGIPDGQEAYGSWCYAGEASCTPGGTPDANRELDPRMSDTDGDGLPDGLEIGLVTPTQHTDVDLFAPDQDPSKTTDPTLEDTDGDGLCDGPVGTNCGGDASGEDKNGNGRKDAGETDPENPDTDGDGLCDGGTAAQGCTGGWEDFNGNGKVDKEADGTLTETDPLSKDSDVDGLEDKDEITIHGTDPRLPDDDGDGLRDGQEVAGWTVGIWYERTMEKKEDYHVTSDPTLADTDGDGLNDFSEFLNGSDPRKDDTDGDRILDLDEIEGGYNITGIEGAPPRIENVQIHVFPNIGLKLDWCPVSDETKLVVFFDIFDNVGTDRVKVSMRRGVDMAAFFAAAQSGGDPSAAIVWESRVVHLGGARERSSANGDGIAVVFQFSLWGAAAEGTDVNITAWDLNGNAAWGQFHVESLAEKIAKAIAAFFEAVAKIIVEAASAFISWIWDALKGMVKPVADSLANAQVILSAAFAAAIGTFGPPGQAAAVSLDDAISTLSGIFYSSALMALSALIAVITVGALLLMTPIMMALPFLLLLVPPFISLLVAAILVPLALPSEGPTGQGDSRVGSTSSMVEAFGDSPATNRAGEIPIVLAAIALTTIVVGFFLKVRENPVVEADSTAGSVETGIGLILTAVSIMIPGILISAFTGAVGFDCHGMPQTVCGGMTNEQRIERERNACFFYRLGLGGQVIGLLMDTAGAIKALAKASAAVGIFATVTLIWSFAWFLIDWNSPPPHCDPMTGYHPA